jgi:hypothetical protein
MSNESPKRKNYKTGWDQLTTKLLVEVLSALFGPRLESRDISLEDAMDEFFNIDSREIYKGRVDTACDIKGDHWLSETTRLVHTGPRHLRKGQDILIRCDKRDNGAVDVQVKLRDETDQMFSLTAKQWDGIKDNITVVYTSVLTGKDVTRARHLKIYHNDFVTRHLGCRFEYRTATGLVRPNFKGTKK